MVKVGNVYWQGEIRGAGEAQQQADSLQESQEEVAGSFLGAATAQETSTEATKTNTEATETNERLTSRLQVQTGLLSSALTFLTSNFGLASAAATVYSSAVGLAAGATTLLNGAITTTYGLLAGPAGLAAGTFLATAGVGLLASELLGLTDVTPVVQSETDTMSGAFADMAFLVGGPLTGYLGSAFLALTGDFQGAKNMFVNTSVEWAKAAARFAARVRLGFETMWNGIRSVWRTSIERLDYAWRAGVNTFIQVTNRGVENIHDGLVGGMESAVNDTLSVVNGFIDEYNRRVGSIPWIDEIEPLQEVSFANTAANNVGDISQLENEGLDSRLRRVFRQEGRRQREAMSRARDSLEQFAPDTIGPDRRTRTGLGRRAFLPGEDPRAVRRRNRRRRGLSPRRGGGASARTTRRRRRGLGAPPPGAGGDSGPTEQNISVEIGDQSLDLSNLSRGDLRTLARLIGDELGGDTTDKTGARA